MNIEHENKSHIVIQDQPVQSLPELIHSFSRRFVCYYDLPKNIPDRLVPEGSEFLDDGMKLRVCVNVAVDELLLRSTDVFLQSCRDFGVESSPVAELFKPATRPVPPAVPLPVGNVKKASRIIVVQD